MKIGINLDADFRNKAGAAAGWVGASAAAGLNGVTWSNDAITVCLHSPPHILRQWIIGVSSLLTGTSTWGLEREVRRFIMLPESS